MIPHLLRLVLNVSCETLHTPKFNCPANDTANTTILGNVFAARDTYHRVCRCAASIGRPLEDVGKTLARNSETRLPHSRGIISQKGGRLSYEHLYYHCLQFHQQRNAVLTNQRLEMPINNPTNNKYL